MSYRIAGIDVHKKMLAVVVSSVEVESEFQFERRMFGSNPEQLRVLAAWLLEQEAEEVVMESTAQYWKPVWETLERIGSRSARSGKEPGGGPERCILRRRSPIAGGTGGRGISSMPSGW
jgi:hypothetical protein